MLNKDFFWFDAWWKQTVSLRERPAMASLISAPPALHVDRFALELVAASLCQQPLSDGSACGECPSCGWVREQQHPDLRWLRPDAEQEEEAAELAVDNVGEKGSRVLRIDQIRSLLTFSQVSSHRGASRWALIGPVEAMHFTAANALLKGLEEPNPDMRYLLYGERLQGVPPTILSRCRRVHLSLDATEAITQRLAQAGAQDWLVPLLRKGVVSPTAWAQAAAKTPPVEVLDLLQFWLVDLARAQYGLEPRSFKNESSVLAGQAQRLSRLPFGHERVTKGFSAMLAHAKVAQHPLNPQLFYETIFEDFRLAISP